MQFAVIGAVIGTVMDDVVVLEWGVLGLSGEIFGIAVGVEISNVWG